MTRLSRLSPKKSSSIPTTAKYTAPPLLQPKATKKSPKPLPEWKPGGSGMGSPLQRLIDAKAAQAKLTIGQANDKYEQEADAVAKDVVQRLHSPEAEAALPETVQRDSVEQEEDLLQAKPIVQRSLGGGEAASSELESSINQAKAGGQPLDAGLQRSMGQAMGADFSGVRVHTDGNADRLNQSIQAKAFTTGQDVFFRQGEYQPGTKGGQELIAHELTHVVQQKGAKVQTKKDIAQTTTETDRNISSDRKLQTGDIMADVLRSPHKTTSSKQGQQRLPIQYQNRGTEGIINRAVSDNLKKGKIVLVKHNGRWTEGKIYKKRMIKGQIEYYVQLTYDAFSKWIPNTSKDIETASIGYQLPWFTDEVNLPKGLNCGEYAAKGAVKLGSEENIDVDFKDTKKWQDSGKMGWEPKDKATAYFSIGYACDIWDLNKWQEQLKDKGPLVVGGVFGQNFMVILQGLKEKYDVDLGEHSILVVGAEKDKKGNPILLYLDSLKRGLHKMPLDTYKKHGDGVYAYVKKDPNKQNANNQNANNQNLTRRRKRNQLKKPPTPARHLRENI